MKFSTAASSAAVSTFAPVAVVVLSVPNRIMLGNVFVAESLSSRENSSIALAVPVAKSVRTACNPVENAVLS